MGRQYGIYLHALDQYSHFHNIIDRYVDTNDGYLVQVTQPVGYVKLCRVHNVIKSTAEWRARRAQIVRAWTLTLIVCAYLSVVCEALTFHVCACVSGLRIIYVGAFAF